MPWRIESRGDEWCVIKEDDGEVEGCHASRERALAQQRALYANEQSRTAAANGEPAPVVQPLQIMPYQLDESLVASMLAISERLAQHEQMLDQISQTLARAADAYTADREAFLAALTAAVSVPAPEAPVVYVTVPDQPSPVVNVRVPEQRPPDVNVTVEAQPVKQKKVVFQRDLATGQALSASIEEVEEWQTT